MHVQTFSVDTSWLHNVTEIFLLFIKFKFLWKIVFLRKLKLIYCSTPQHYNTCSATTSLIFFKKFLDPHPHLKKRAQTMHSIWEITKERQKSYYHSIWQIFYLQNFKVTAFEENQNIIWKIIYLISQVTFIFLIQIYYITNFITLSSNFMTIWWNEIYEM